MATKKMETIQSINPATLEIVGEVEVTPTEEIPLIVEKARAAQKDWWKLGFSKRAEYLIKARDYMMANVTELVDIIHKDTGKPRIEAFATEIYPCLDALSYYAKNGEKMLRRESIRLSNPMFLTKRSYIDYQPLGVVAIISPWNYPFGIPFHLVGAALMSGNSVVLKASSETPLVGVMMGKIFEGAGLPEGLLHVISGPGRIQGQAIAEAKVGRIFFIGSVDIGRHVMQTAAKNMVTVNMELGGKDPMIVLGDADLERAANGAVWGAFTNAGQTCAAVERLYIHESEIGRASCRERV